MSKHRNTTDMEHIKEMHTPRASRLRVAPWVADKVKGDKLKKLIDKTNPRKA